MLVLRDRRVYSARRRGGENDGDGYQIETSGVVKEAYTILRRHGSCLRQCRRIRFQRHNIVGTAPARAHLFGRQVKAEWRTRPNGPLERTSGRLGASCRRNRSAVVCARRAGHGTGVHGGAARPGATGVRARRAEPGAGRGAVRGRGEHPLPVAADLADRGPTGGEAARRRARATPGRGSARPAEGAGGRGQRPHPGRVRGLAPRARRGGGERPDRVPGAREARPHAQKRRCGPRSRTGPSWPRPAPRGGPSWPGSSRGAWCSSTSAASTPG